MSDEKFTSHPTGQQPEVYDKLAQILGRQKDTVVREIEQKQMILTYLGNAQELARVAGDDMRAMDYSKVDLSMTITNLNSSGVAMINSASIPYLGSSTASAKLIFDQLSSNCSNAVYTTEILKIEAFPKTKKLLEVLKIELKPLVDKLVELVKGIDESAHQRALAFKASLSNTTNPHHFSDAATNLRETLRLLYYAKAPDVLIEKWAHVQIDNERPTRMSRLRFAAFRNLDPKEYPEAFCETVEIAAKGAKAAYERLSGYTHRSDEKPISQDRALPELHEATDSILKWIDTCDASQSVRLDMIYPTVDKAVNDIMMNDLHSEIEKSYSHAYITEVYLDDLVIDSENHEASYFSGSGSVSFVGQYGSDGDVRRGDGVEFDCHRNFRFSGSFIHGEPSEIDLHASNFELEDEFPEEYSEDQVS